MSDLGDMVEGESPSTVEKTAEKAKTPLKKVVDNDDTSGQETTKVVNWKAYLMKKKNGQVEPVLANAITALREAPEWQGIFRFNEFSLVPEILRPPPWKHMTKRAEDEQNFKPRPWTDQDDNHLTEWLQRERIMITPSIACAAVQTVAKENTFHPVREYLLGLEWDGTPRIDNWLETYLGADASDYTKAIGPRWLISAIARIMQPGPECKADCVLILEGAQGTYKSTALRVLAGKWFTDELRKFGSKDAAMQISGRWIVEISELTGMNEVSIEACKGFLSQTVDRFRPPYGRAVIDNPRQCVFAATTNQNAFLKDETGERRYWPVSCFKVEIDALSRDRDQIWAEALSRFNAGAPWWLDTAELRALAEAEQSQRFDADPWEPAIAQFLRDREVTSPEYLLENLFDYQLEDITKGLRNRVSSILRHLKWHRVQIRAGEKRGSYVWEPTVHKDVSQPAPK